MITISLFYCCEKVFILINIWMIGKNLLKLYFLKKEHFYSHLNMEDVTDPDQAHTKKVCKSFEIKFLKNIMFCMFKAIHYC